MFDKKAWIREYIESKTVRDHMERAKLSFSDTEMATITFNSGKPLRTIQQTLEELAAYTADRALKEQIWERIAYDRRCLELFEANDGSFFYQVSLNADAEHWECGEAVGHFATVKLALEYMADRKVPFSVEKYQILGLREQIITVKGHWNPRLFPGKPVEEFPYDGSAIGSCSYDADGILLRYRTEEIGDEERDKVDNWGTARFEHHYIALSNPFERGDLVRCVNASDTIGVVETSRTDWLEWEKRVRERNLKLDYYDASITVEFPTERGTFFHDHISPIYLEKIDPIVLDGDDRKELLEVAGCMLKGQASLSWFAHVCENYRQKQRKEKA